MAKNFSVALNMILNSAEYTQSLKRVVSATEGMKRQLESIGNTIKSIVGLGLAAVGAASAFEAFKKVMESTDITGDKLAEVMNMAEQATGTFFRTVANGDWSNLLVNMEKAIKAGREYAQALDYIENKSRGNSISNAEDERRISEIRLELAKAKAKGAAGTIEADRLIQEALTIRQNELTRNVALGAKKYEAELNKITSRGVDEKTLNSWMNYSRSAEYNEEGVNQYRNLLGQKKMSVVESASIYAAQGASGIADQVKSDQFKNINDQIDKLLNKYPELLKYDKLLMNASGEEIEAMAKAYIGKIEAETEINKANLKLTKQAIAIDLAGGKADEKAEKQKQDIRDKTGLMNELNAKVTELEERQKQATTIESFVRFGAAIIAAKTDVENLNRELSVLTELKGGRGGGSVKSKSEGQPLNNNLMGMQPGGSGYNAQAYVKKFQDAAALAEEKIIQLENSVNSAVQSMVGGAFAAIGTGIGELLAGSNAAKSFEDFGKSIMGLVGKFLVQMGEALVAYGVGMNAFKLAFSNPFAAIGAGVALIAAGSALSSLAAAGPSGAGSSSASSSGSSYSNPSSATQGDNKVVFEVRGDKLVGVLANYDRKNKNIS